MPLLGGECYGAETNAVVVAIERASPLEVVFCERLLDEIVQHDLLQTCETGSERKGDQLLVRRKEI